MPDLTIRRVLSPDEASALVGERVQLPHEPSLPRVQDEPIRLLDADTREVAGIVTRLPAEQLRRLRSSVLGLEMATVARMSGRMDGGGRTFGWSPKRVVNGRESCRATSAARDFPDQHRVLADLSGWLGNQFRQLMPERAVADEAVLRQVRSDWFMDEHALWTSGVVNKAATLPYHRDGMNFHTWSAMPTLRYGMRGGHLHLPEYDLVYPCRDGEVTWFCGRDLVHGVTPMSMARDDAYRYSIVYYALAGMKDCASFAEETASAARRRTERERRIADGARAKLAGAAG